jgi:hypothetical protein
MVASLFGERDSSARVDGRQVLVDQLALFLEQRRVEKLRGEDAFE